MGSLLKSSCSVSPLKRVGSIYLSDAGCLLLRAVNKSIGPYSIPYVAQWLLRMVVDQRYVDSFLPGAWPIKPKSILA